MQELLRLILFPFSWIYGAITASRNHLFNIGYSKSFRFQLPVLNVGNLSVGGNGKTPMVEYLIDLLSPDFKLATLSRGYRRKSRGFILVDQQQSATTVGDEPWQLFSKYGDQVTVSVGEERVLAIPQIIQERPQTEVILLDDAFQHRRIDAHFNILVSDYNRPFYRDFLLPAGRLREARKGASRAQAVVITKCPQQLSNDEQEAIRATIVRYTQAPVWFSSILYGKPQALKDQQVWPTPAQVILVSGLADAHSLKQYVRSEFTLIRHFDYPDHHHYTTANLKEINQFAEQHPQAVVLTTEKDVTKLAEFSSSFNVPWFYLPIKFQFLTDGSGFDNLVLNTLKNLEESLV